MERTGLTAVRCGTSAIVRARDWAVVGAAGPVSIVLIAIALAAVLSAATLAGVTNSSSRLTEILAVGIFLNALLAVFNLIPIPPLDGSRVIQYLLGGEAFTLYRQLERFGIVIIVPLVVPRRASVRSHSPQQSSV